MVNIHEILNGPRSYCFYEPAPDSAETLESLQELAYAGLLNGPEGNEFILRLIEIIKALMNEKETVG